MPHYITQNQIKAHNPCPSEWRKARRLFGKRQRIRVTVKAAVSLAHRVPFCWLAAKLLTAPAQAEYFGVTAPAWKEYKRIMEAAWKEHIRSTAPAWAEYARVEAAAYEEYKRIRAAAFARSYLAQ